MRRRGVILAVILMVVPGVILLMASLHSLLSMEANMVLWRQAQLQALYLAQAGESIALQGLAGCNFSRGTHTSAGQAESAESRLVLEYPGLALAADGWYVWNGTGLGQQNVEQSFRLQVLYPVAGEWLIRVEGRHGGAVRTLLVRGRLEGLFEYAIFDAGDLSEFVRGVAQTVGGRIHANGDLFLRPSDATLTLLTESLTSAGRIIRSRDAWGRADQGGTVRISSGSAAGTLVEMAGGANGTAFDSGHADWKTALTRWQGVVKDGSLGASSRLPLGLETMQPDGYYDQHAGLSIDSTTPASSWCTQRTFYNQAEGRWITVQQLDLAALAAAGGFPANGLLYSSEPLRLVNAARLHSALTVVSPATIYTVGDFNKDYPTLADRQGGTSQRVPAALLTSDRLYHLSAAFNDSVSSASSIPTAAEPPLFAGDDADLLEINAALVDGAPTVDERNWQVGSSYYDTNHRAGVNAWANSDDFLENWTNLTVSKRGSTVHLQNAVMAALNNIGSGTPWIVKTHYQAPTRNYSYDASFQTTPPPLTPYVSRLVRWELTQ